MACSSCEGNDQPGQDIDDNAEKIESEIKLVVNPLPDKTLNAVKAMGGVASQRSLDITPDLLCDKIKNKKHLQKSHSWTFPASVTGDDSTLDFKDDSKSTVPRFDKTCNISSDSKEGNEKVVRRTRPTYRNVHATRSLNEQELQAFGEHLEQSMLVELLIDPCETQETSLNQVPAPLFALEETVTGECSVCFATTLVRPRKCCNDFICDGCFNTYLTTMIEQRVVTMQCPMYGCKKYLSQVEIAHHVDHKICEKFYRFILEANCEPHMKTCPCCNVLKTVDKNLVTKQSWSSFEAKVCCEQCAFEWCFPCHSPWHDGISCQESSEGDRLLTKWAQKSHGRTKNAQKCPKCKVFIQWISGCYTMTCTQCKTQFCYRCGEMNCTQCINLCYRCGEMNCTQCIHLCYRCGDRIRWGHYSRYSIFGCNYEFKPNNPVQRRVIRGAVSGLYLLASLLCVGLAVCLFVPALFVITLLLLIYYYGVWKRHKNRDQIQRENMELGDPWVFKLYSARRAYQMGDGEFEVAYP